MSFTDHSTLSRVDRLVSWLRLENQSSLAQSLNKELFNFRKLNTFLIILSPFILAKDRHKVMHVNEKFSTQVIVLRNKSARRSKINQVKQGFSNNLKKWWGEGGEG